MSLAANAHELKLLILSFHPLIAIDTVEEERVDALLHQTSRELNLPLFEWTISRGLRRLPNPMGIGDTIDPLRLLQHLETLTVEGIFLLKDFSPYLEQAAVSRRFREVIQRFSQTHATLVLTGSPIVLPAAIEPSVLYYTLTLPSPAELHETLLAVIRSLRTQGQIQIQLQAQDVQALLRALRGMTLNQARQAIAHAALVDGKLSVEDVQRVMQRKMQIIREGGPLEYFPVEDNRYELGGFGRLRTWLKQAQVGFSAEAQALNLAPPKGILLVGIQGCGKSLAAKVIAREWQLPLLKLDIGELYDKYIGESEKNLRRAIALVESMAPVVLWIDEIEKGLSPSQGESDGGLGRRLFGSLLTWLQEKRQEVFVVATANDLGQLPPELLRKGRFDEIFFVDLPTEAERLEIFQIHLSLRKQRSEKFDLPRLVAATEGFSGAEIEQVVIASLYRALYLKLPLDTALLLQEIQATVPLSVSRQEEIQYWRTSAQGRFVSVR